FFHADAMSLECAACEGGQQYGRLRSLSLHGYRNQALALLALKLACQADSPPFEFHISPLHAQQFAATKAGCHRQSDQGVESMLADRCDERPSLGGGERLGTSSPERGGPDHACGVLTLDQVFEHGCPVGDAEDIECVLDAGRSDASCGEIAEHS